MDAEPVDAPEFSCDVIRGGDEIIVRISGEVDMSTAPRLEEVLRDAPADSSRRIVVDLAQVGFIDSSGLGALARSLLRARAAGVALVLRSPQPHARKVLTLTGLDAEFTIES